MHVSPWPYSIWLANAIIIKNESSIEEKSHDHTHDDAGGGGDIAAFQWGKHARNEPKDG